MSRHLAVDIGGSSARCSLAEFDGESLAISPLHTFPNRPIRLGDEWYWDARGLLGGIKQALAAARADFGPDIDSLAIDSMGNAFGLLDGKGEPLSPPSYTRLPQEERVKDILFDAVGRAETYRIVGLEQGKINSLYYLLRYRLEKPELLDRARHFLMLPDLLGYWLTGEIGCEYTIASTSYLVDAAGRDWSQPLIGRLGLNPAMFPAIHPAGSPVGRLRPELAAELGLPNLRVVRAAAHDTSSAIVCLGDDTRRSAFISSGTWGMLGCKLPEPLLTAEAMRANFANEGAAFGRIKFVHNSPSMSILQACLEDWAASGPALSWHDLFELAERAPPFLARLDLDAPCLRGRSGMVGQIRRHCRETGQAEPDGPGEVARVVLESIAADYLRAMDALGGLVGGDFSGLTVVGGASKAGLLLQFIADALCRRVTLGPVESSTLGNVLMQLLALGEIGSMEEGGRLSRPFFRGAVEPGESADAWRDFAGRG